MVLLKKKKYKVNLINQLKIPIHLIGCRLGLRFSLVRSNLLKNRGLRNNQEKLSRFRTTKLLLTLIPSRHQTTRSPSRIPRRCRLILIPPLSNFLLVIMVSRDDLSETSTNATYKPLKSMVKKRIPSALIQVLQALNILSPTSPTLWTLKLAKKSRVTHWLFRYSTAKLMRKCGSKLMSRNSR